MDWQETCTRLWGPDWIAPAAEVIGVNRRTVERWRSGAIAIPDGIARDIERIGAVPDPTRYGAILRRLARGESPEEIRADLVATQQALIRVRHDLGRYRTIATLAGTSSAD